MLQDCRAGPAPNSWSVPRCRLFGEADHAAAEAQPTVLGAGEATGLAAAVQALRQHAAELEQRGVLPTAAAGEDGWLLPEGGAADGCNDGGGAALPAYLQRDAAGHALDERYQHWPAAAGAAAGDIDAIQDADGADAWQALDAAGGDLAAASGCAPLQLNLQLHCRPAAAPGGVHVAFDDEPAQHAQHPHAGRLQVGGSAAAAAAAASAAQDGADDLLGWGDDEGADPRQPQDHQRGAPMQPQLGQHSQQAGGRGRLPAFPARRQQLALAASQPREAEWEEEEEWDDAMLEQVGAGPGAGSCPDGELANRSG